MTDIIQNKNVCPRTKLYLRGKHGMESIWGLNSYFDPSNQKLEQDDAFSCSESDLVDFSRNGKYVAIVSREKGFIVHDTESSSIVLDVENPGIQALTWSPMGTFLVTWQRLNSEMNEGNLIVWNSTDGKIVSRYHQKIFSKEQWPSMQWTSDEALCARSVKNEVQILNGKDLTSGIISKIILSGVSTFSVAPGPAPYKISTFVPEKKGKPANVRIYHFPNLETPKASKSFYKSQQVEMKWSPNGGALIAQTSTDVDTSGKSYYGETGLFFLQSDGDFDCIVPLTKEGLVHDVQWDPTGKGFVVLAGPMPCNATLYDNRAGPIFEFGSAHRNHICWSPHGRFLCLAGFGNLKGDMDFWDRNKLKKMGSTNSNSATSFCWSPDSRYFLTATTFPRLRVDNGFKLFRYNGEGPILCESRDELYEIKFRPALKDVYPNRPQSPKKKGEVDIEENIPSIAKIEKPQAYRPPRSNGALAAAMLSRSDETGSRKLNRNAYAPSSGIGERRIPGLAPEVIKPKKNKNTKKKKAQEDADAKLAIEKATNVNLQGNISSSIPTTAVVLSEEEKEKRIKHLEKKLKQIQTLKKNKNNGESLNTDQISKIKHEDSILKEISGLKN